jgi:galactokinase
MKAEMPFLKNCMGKTRHIKEQANRYAALLDEFKSTFGGDDVALFSSPGRTEIGGNHTDHNYGRVLAGAVNLDNIAVAGKNNDQCNPHQVRRVSAV